MATPRARGFLDAFRQAYGEGREDWGRAYRTLRDDRNLSENAPRMTEMSGAYPTGVRLMEAIGLGKPDAQLVRSDLGIGQQPAGKGRRIGQILGTLAADATQDNTRSFYWLLNAPQAVTAVTQEQILGKYAPKLFGQTVQTTASGKPMTMKKDKLIAQKRGLLDATERPTRGVRINSQGQIAKRNYEPGDVASLLIPSGLAVNTGIGLMSPFGGAQGYEAAIPDQEDKRKTANVIAEVGSKYFLGQTGNLLPYSQFKQDRPDVNKADYNKYKAFKYDREMDLNPFDDGKITLPGRVVKATTEGIHGPEVQILGKSLPLTTGLVPLASAIAGTTYGATRERPIRGGLRYGLGAFAAGTAAGAITEELRRRASSVSTDNLNNQQL